MELKLNHANSEYVSLKTKLLPRFGIMPKNPEVFTYQTLIKGLYNPYNKFQAHFVSVLETDIVTPIQMAHLVYLPCTILTPLRALYHILKYFLYFMIFCCCYLDWQI